MRWITYQTAAGVEAVGLSVEGGYRGLPVTELGSDLLGLIVGGSDAQQRAAAMIADQPLVSADDIAFLPVLPRPPKIVCIGLNYMSHSEESGFEPPVYPTVFARWNNSLVANGAPIIRPHASDMLDYEGELAIIIGRGGRHIDESDALNHVAGYSVFNDGSIRDFQLRTPQWTIGKTFDGTGGFGPELVTADEVPAGATGLKIETILNGEVVQSASTGDLIFGVAKLISILSEAMTLTPGDVIVSGTPAGVGGARKPPLWMKPGDRCDVRIEGIGTLSNPIAQEQ